MRELLCVCPLVPRLELATRLVVVMHWREANTTTNTGRLAALALPNSEVRVRGVAGERDVTEGIVAPGRRTLLLFPGPDAVALEPGFSDRFPGPYTLVVPDGTWRQARKVATREPSLAGALRVQLEDAGDSAYRLRRAPRTGALSTMEAIARALGVLEGPHAQAPLEALFRVMVERSLASRGAFSRASLPSS